MLDEKGFKKKTYDDVLNDMTATALELYGNDLNVDETSIFGKYLRVNAEQIAQLWEDVEGSYFTAFVNTARGASLDRKMTDFNLTRYQAAQAQGEVTLTGTVGYTLPLGTTLATDGDLLFYTTRDVQLDENGTAKVSVTAEEPGITGNVLAGAINSLLYPDEHITSVTNEKDTMGGRGIETDYEFRDRMKKTLAHIGSATMDAVISALFMVQGVLAVSIFENESNTTDENGIPGHSFHAYVYGGSDEDVAATIFDKKPIGIGMIGDIEMTVNDIAGNPHTVYFSRPVEVNPQFKVNLKVNTAFPSDGIKQVKTAILKYVGGIDEDQTFYTGLSMGDDVLFMKLVSRITAIEGIDDFTFTMSKDGTEFSTNNIVIAMNELAVTNYSKISVVIEA